MILINPNQSEPSCFREDRTPIMVIAGSDFLLGDCQVGIRKDLKNKRFGMLIAKRLAGKNKSGRTLWFCHCDCGKESITTTSNLINGHTKSCGCIRKFNSVTHGMYYHPLYNVWNAMKQRCYNPNHLAYYRYGGRKIKVCNEWQSFKPFADWAISNGYKKGLTIDRINNNGNYEPNNCRFVSYRRQANNRKNNHFITYQGETMTLADWGRRVSINPRALLKRLNRGWCIDKTLNTPLMQIK